MVALASPGFMQLARAFATTSSATSVSIASVFGLSTARLDTPMSTAISVPVAPASSALATAPKLESSVVEGISVTSISSASPVSSVGLILPGGSSHETASTAGASRVMQQLAFKATANRTTFRLARELEKIGATASAVAGRESISFGVAATSINMKEATEILLDAVLNPRFNYWEVTEAVAVVKAQFAAGLTCPASVLNEVLHRTAFEGSLGQPLLNSPSALDGFTNDTLRECAAELLTASNMVLAGAGLDHGELKATAGPLLEDYCTSRSPVTPGPSTYVGGCSSVLLRTPLTYAALAFEAKGGLTNPKVAALAAVTQALLDGTKSVLPRQSSLAGSFMGFASLYKGTGLVGVASSAESGSALISSLFKKVEALGTGPADAQLALAKSLALAKLKFSLSTSAGALSVMGPVLQATGSFDSADLASKISAVTSAEVAAFVSSSAKNPTLVTAGALSSIPKMPKFF
eukprot:gene20206-26951_t